MKDPNQEPEPHPIDPPQPEEEVADDNFEETQSIDEEGNELDPEDIK
jgi:hypothetical protein